MLRPLQKLLSYIQKSTTNGPATSTEITTSTDRLTAMNKNNFIISDNNETTAEALETTAAAPETTEAAPETTAAAPETAVEAPETAVEAPETTATIINNDNEILFENNILNNLVDNEITTEDNEENEENSKLSQAIALDTLHSSDKEVDSEDNNPCWHTDENIGIEESIETEIITASLDNSLEKSTNFCTLDDNSFENHNPECEEPEFASADLLSDNLNNSLQSDQDILADPFGSVGSVSSPSLIKSLESTSNEIIDHIDDIPDVLYIIDVEEIKEKNTEIGVIDETNKSDKLYLCPDVPAKENEKQSEIITEEQEIRSDNSDSGLGSDTAAGNIHSKSSSNIIKLSSNLKRRSDNNANPGTTEKRPKKSLQFDNVNVYYFPRVQGFGCVPSQGGCTLGMGSRHITFKSFTLAEHTAEQRRVHKLQLQEINPKGTSSDETDSDDELSEASLSDLDADTTGFLQPVTAKQRRALLKSAGVRKIDPTEKEDCRTIRSSREFCGCNCRGYCDPDNCSCSRAGIKCQVDRPSFPCGCSRDGCGNLFGRIEFNPDRVRRHFIHTITRLSIDSKEPKQFDTNDSGSGSPNTNLLGYSILDSNIPSTSAQAHYYDMTSQMTNNNKLYSNNTYDLHPHSAINSSYYNESVHLYSSYGEYSEFNNDTARRSSPDANYNPNYNSGYQSYENSTYYSPYSIGASNSLTNTALNTSLAGIESYDLTNNGSNNYINLSTPSNKTDDISDILHISRIVTTPQSTYQITFLEDPVPLNPTTIAQTATPCLLASSGQTSTSVCEGTSTSITQPITNTATIRNFSDSKIDLTLDNHINNEDNSIFKSILFTESSETYEIENKIEKINNAKHIINEENSNLRSILKSESLEICEVEKINNDKHVNNEEISIFRSLLNPEASEDCEIEKKVEKRNNKHNESISTSNSNNDAVGRTSNYITDSNYSRNSINANSSNHSSCNISYNSKNNNNSSSSSITTTTNKDDNNIIEILDKNIIEPVIS